MAFIGPEPSISLSVFGSDAYDHILGTTRISIQEQEKHVSSLLTLFYRLLREFTHGNWSHALK